MHQLSKYLWAATLAALFFAGCSAGRETAIDGQVGDTLAMPVVDAFQVVEMIKGDLKAATISVRALTAGGPAYPRQLAEGKTYRLRLTPSEWTQQQLRENEKEGYSFVWVSSCS